MIDSYSFGKIVIDGRGYSADVIVFPDHVIDNWWRKEGHRLYIEDLKEVLEEKPEVLVVGTGHSGLVKVLTDTKDYVESRGIELIIKPTREACETFNDAMRSGRKVAAALHLTC